MNKRIIVIGSGPSGAYSAALLAESGFQVTLIEEGLPGKISKPFSLEEIFTKYKYSGLSGSIGNPPISYASGSCLGGGSEINSGIYHRLPSTIYYSWSKSNNLLDFNYNCLDEYFEDLERELSVSLSSNGIAKSGLKLINGASNLGWNGLEVPRWIKSSAGELKKQTMCVTMIPRAIRSGVNILTGHTVTHLKFKNGKWHISGLLKNGDHFNNICDVLFLCAGAIYSPFLLKINSLSNNAGRTLYMHPSIKVTAKFSEVVNDGDVPPIQITEFRPHIGLGCSISSYEHLIIALVDCLNGVDYVRENWRYMANYYASITEGKGSITILPFSYEPLVHYDLGEMGFDLIKLGLEKLCECLFAAGANQLFMSTFPPLIVRSMTEAKEKISLLERASLKLMTIHLMGGCDMGENLPHAVTDSFGKVHGQKSLYVNDSSLFCGPIGVNPQGTIMALARRNIENFINNYEA